MEIEKLYTLAETAKNTGYNEQHLRKLCRDRKVAHTVKGDRYFFTEGEAAALIVHVSVPVPVAPNKKTENAKTKTEKTK